MDGIKAIDAVVNPNTDEIAKYRPSYISDFHKNKLKHDDEDLSGTSVEGLLDRMDRAGTERAFLIAAKVGQIGLPGSWHIPYEPVADLVQNHPDRFHGIAGIDPTEGMNGVRALEHAVKEYGFIGAHLYPHWFELAPDHARYYPFYAKCVELDIPIQMQVGQSLVYTKERPLRSVGRPISLDAVACDFPELRLIGIHVGIPWTDEMIAMAWKHENVFIGCDAHAPKYWPASFVQFINTYGQDKVIFGTDYPALEMARMREEIDALKLRPNPLKKLLRDNAIRIYKLNL